MYNHQKLYNIDDFRQLFHSDVDMRESEGLILSLTDKDKLPAVVNKALDGIMLSKAEESEYYYFLISQVLY